MKKLLTTLTLLFTLCSFAIGQDDYHFGVPEGGPDFNMTVASIIYLDGEMQTNQTIEIAAFIDGELCGICKTYNTYPTFPDPYNGYYYREFTVLGYTSDNGKKVTFKGYNHDTQEELIIHDDSDELIYEAQTAILVSAPLKLYFTSPEQVSPVAKVGNTEYNTIDEAVENWTAGSTLTLLSDVTLSDVITLKSTEHHILNLGSYIMTAAEGKNAIEIKACGTGDAERSAITINADATNPGGINAGNKSVVYYNYANGGITTNDRPIIKINGGVFAGATSSFGTAGIYFKGGTAARQAATLHITGGTFNCSINGQSKSKLKIEGGVFNYSVGSQGDSTANRLISGGTFKSFGFMTADSNNTKFWFGTSMGNSNVGVYINDDNYLVVGGSVITEAGETFQASSANYSGWNNLLQYSSAKENGLYYTSAIEALNDNNKTSGSVNIYTESLDLTSLNYKGTLNISNTLTVTFAEGTEPAWTVTASDKNIDYTDVIENGVVTRTYVLINSEYVAKIGEVYYTSLKGAVESAQNNETITLLKDVEGSGVVINKSLTIDFGSFTYTFTSPAVGSNGTTSNGFQILNDNTVTLQNGTLNVAETNKNDYYMLIQNYANLTVEGMTLDGTYLDKWVVDYEDSYVLSNNSGTVNISNSTIIANNDGTKSFAFDACKYANYEAPVVNLASDVVVKGNVELNGGQIYHTQTINGVAKKSFKGGQSYWGTISTPIANAVIPAAAAGKHDLYRYDEPTMMWNYYNDGQNDYTALELGRGYLYANTNDVTVELKGAFNVSDVQFALSYTDGNALAGFNMVGNPFAHNITDAYMIPDVELAGGFYTISENGGFVAKTAGSVIAPMEAVLVKATAPNRTLVITPTPTTTSKRSTTDNGVIAINVSNENYSDITYVSFNEGIGLDKIDHRNANVPMIYVPVEGVNYAIAMMNQDVTEIPVSFKAATMGEYTISVEAQGCEYSKILLNDRLTGNVTNLLIEDYTFMATSKDNDERFFITLDNSQQSTDNSHFAYINNGMIKIDDVEGNGVVRVIDVLGRPVAEYNVQESAAIPTASFTSGVYMIQMMDNNGVKVQKILID